jgi:hypothetical protein
VTPDPTGRFLAWPNFEATRLGHAYRREGNTFVLLARPRDGEPTPKPKWSTWRKRDHEALARKALEAAGLPTDLPIHAYPGGAMVDGLRQHITFADERTAIFTGFRALSFQQTVVTLEASP